MILLKYLSVCTLRRLGGGGFYTIFSICMSRCGICLHFCLAISHGECTKRVVWERQWHRPSYVWLVVSFHFVEHACVFINSDARRNVAAKRMFLSLLADCKHTLSHTLSWLAHTRRDADTHREPHNMNVKPTTEWTCHYGILCHVYSPFPRGASRPHISMEHIYCIKASGYERVCKMAKAWWRRPEFKMFVSMNMV